MRVKKRSAGLASRGLLVVIVVLGLLAGCRRSQPPMYGPEFNAERVKRGITPIGSNWTNINTRNNGTDATWLPPGSAGANGARHSYKTVQYAGGQVQSETDFYLSGRSFPSKSPDGGTDFEGAAITYSYAAERAGQNPWTCSVPAGTVSRAAFDAVLASWGLKE
jgi:hypothetical protein